MTAPEPKVVRVTAPAKLNLYLHVVGKRADGYHLLDSLIAFAGIHDVLDVRHASRDFTVEVIGEFAASVPADEDNLVLRAARALAEEYRLEHGAHITLNKRLPPASGMGGGSADAAATLKALTGLWNLDPRGDQLLELALQLGADVPACLMGRAAFMGGIGEELVPAPTLPPAWVVLVNPGVEVPTPAVFGARSGPFSQGARFSEAPADAARLAELLAERRNDLTDAAVAIAPEVGLVLAALETCPGNLLARMTGSGATCFGIFPDVGAATQATMSLARSHPGWWVKVASLENDTGKLG